MMQKVKYWSVTLLFVVALGMAFERPAHAYVDPGSCLLLFQSLGAVASGVLFYFRRRLKRLSWSQYEYSFPDPGYVAARLLGSTPNR